MAMVIMTCGKICSGKSTYAEEMRKKYKGVLLSVDEITLALFGQHTGDKHDEYVARAEEYLFHKSLEILENGIDVILDWGFWTKAERIAAKEFYDSRNIRSEFHYTDIAEDEWLRRLDKRNKAVLSGEASAYYVDENLAKKFGSIFEKPDEDEIDVIVRQ